MPATTRRAARKPPASRAAPPEGPEAAKETADAKKKAVEKVPAARTGRSTRSKAKEAQALQASEEPFQAEAIDSTTKVAENSREPVVGETAKPATTKPRRGKKQASSATAPEAAPTPSDAVIPGDQQQEQPAPVVEETKPAVAEKRTKPTTKVAKPASNDDDDDEAPVELKSTVGEAKTARVKRARSMNKEVPDLLPADLLAKAQEAAEAARELQLPVDPRVEHLVFDEEEDGDANEDNAGDQSVRKGPSLNVTVLKKQTLSSLQATAPALAFQQAAFARVERVSLLKLKSKRIGNAPSLTFGAKR